VLQGVEPMPMHTVQRFVDRRSFVAVATEGGIELAYQNKKGLPNRQAFSNFGCEFWTRILDANFGRIKQPKIINLKIPCQLSWAEPR